MSVVGLQRLDRWLGAPLCLVLTLVRALRRLLPARPPGPVRRVLFVKLAEQGSTVLAYDALRRAVELVGRQNVFFISFAENRFILDLLGVVPEENVVTLSTQNLFGLLGSALAAVARLRRLQLDSTVDLEFFSRGSAILAFLSGAPRRVGLHAFYGGGPYRGDLMTHKLVYTAYLHTSQIFRALVEALLHEPRLLPAFGAPPPAETASLPHFTPAAAEQEKVRRLLGYPAGALPPLLVLNPNAGDMLPVRRWPAGRYVELAKELLARHEDWMAVFTGAPEEAEAVAELARRVGSPRCVCLAGKTTLRELLVLYSLGEVLVTNDSGPAHFAAMTPISVVTLFGPETPALFAPRTPRHTALYAGLACSPCVNAYNNRQTPCQNNLCMQAITVQEVLRVVEGLSAERARTESAPGPRP